MKERLERECETVDEFQRGIYLHTYTVALVFNVFEKHYNQIGVYTKKLKIFTSLFSKSRKKNKKNLKPVIKTREKKFYF